MSDPTLIILYVDEPERSGHFYADLLGRPPIEASTTFVIFKLDSGVKIGLWSRHTVEPAATVAGGGGELAFLVDRNDLVDTTYALWKQRGLQMLQQPADLDFGRTFVALDPDGHRLRVYAMSEVSG